MFKLHLKDFRELAALGWCLIFIGVDLKRSLCAVYCVCVRAGERNGVGERERKREANKAESRKMCGDKINKYTYSSFLIEFNYHGLCIIN